MQLNWAGNLAAIGSANLATLGAWISTSYLIGEIIVIPLTDYLSRVFSFRRFLLINAILFLAFSTACAFARDLPEMIALRAIQGFTGGVLIPMAFTLVLTKLSEAQRPIGMALFAITATFAPAIGPTIGGYLTKNYGWQYIFFINLVPGAIQAALPLLGTDGVSSAQVGITWNSCPGAECRQSGGERRRQGKQGRGSALDPRSGGAPLNPSVKEIAGGGTTPELRPSWPPPLPRSSSPLAPAATALSVVEGRSLRLTDAAARPTPADYDHAAGLYRAERWEEARAAVQAVLAVQPDHAPAVNLLGVLHRIRGEFSQALACLERAAALDPNNETASINLGNVHLDLEAADAAVETYTRGLAAAPRHGLRDRIRRAPLGDTRRWVRDFEALTLRTVESTDANAASVLT